ncbi:mucoidy inhibitor MuiA family protein [Phytohabitans sp. ZYX-F-186]|uniref:Mucoidy inhibitor MuiA family protein n=1 Tax=Phytohabitans maris TaxID=3071409 RepID=A0ABU0ZB46_9ACTN|nr:mucoidy inhibitor MuiA family protein [Phytohabitans sp. ZYX-F-186]MDQ7903172.1 mucoidy inhibitor MuiA family protein [Phytohabitans sp. ZYX-F-186]
MESVRERGGADAAHGGGEGPTSAGAVREPGGPDAVHGGGERPASAGPVVLDAPIVAVTVYPDRARVTRRGKLRPPAGLSTVHIGPLPLGLHRDSVRVGGHGPATVLGVDVVVRHHPRPTDETVARVEEARRAVTAELAELADDEAVEAQRAEFLATLAQRAGSTYARAVAAGEADPAAVATFADSIADQLAAGKARQRDLARRAEEARDRKDALDRRLKEVSGKRGPDQLAAAVSLQVTAAEGVELELSYVVEGAGWESTYDVRLADDRLAVTWFGLVTQHTGEDWPECELVLSTARPATTTTVPDLDPWYLDRIRPLPVARAVAASRSREMLRAGGPPVPPPAAMPAGFGGDAFAGDAEVAMLAESTGVVEQGVAAATYRPEHPVAVPADGTAHRATVAVLDLGAELDYVTAPAQSPDAHLRATAVNTSAHTLLPGPASVFHDADFVGTTRLETWAPGEEVELALGLDDRIRVERKLTRRTATKAALGSTRRREVEYRTTVANHTPRPAKVTVLDQIPVSRDEGITVRAFKVDPNPVDRTDLGVLSWKLELAPGETKEVNMGLRVELARGVEMSGWRE